MLQFMYQRIPRFPGSFEIWFLRTSLPTGKEERRQLTMDCDEKFYARTDYDTCISRDFIREALLTIPISS